MTTKDDLQKVVIGRSESIDFVGTDVLDVPAKIDTGAYRSALHASDIVLKDGLLSFNILGNHPVCGNMTHKIETRDFNEVRIANSFGHAEDRYEVRLKVKIGSEVFTTSFSLADRSKKVYPVLLGRKLLSNRYLVDTSKSTIDRRELKERFNVDFPQDSEETDL